MLQQTIWAARRFRERPSCSLRDARASVRKSCFSKRASVFASEEAAEGVAACDGDAAAGPPTAPAAVAAAEGAADGPAAAVDISADLQKVSAVRLYRE